MAHVPDLIATDVRGHQHRHDTRSLLRLIVCGNVEDGKSVLLDRLLHDSRKWGTQGDDTDFALPAECEQGVTIDATRCFFSTDRRRYIVADTPNPEQYARDMLTGAAAADVALILIDASKGLSTQSRRRTYVVKLIGIRQVVLAVNQMHLVHYSRAVFDRLDEEYRAFAAQIGLSNVTSIPLSAPHNDNFATHSTATPWYEGPTLMHLLETASLDEACTQRQPLRLPIQRVTRPSLGFRSLDGLIVGGTLVHGQQIRVQPCGRQSTVTRIVAVDGDRQQAVAGESVTLTLADEVDISRGDVISAAASPAEVADQFEATLIWMAEEPLLPGRPYLMQIGTRTAGIVVTEIKHKVNVDTLEHVAVTQLGMDAIGVGNLSLDCAVPFDAYADNHTTGGFLIIDRSTNTPMGIGMLNFALRRARNIHMEYLHVDKLARSALKGQRPLVLWFTGLSGAGKSTIANRVEQKLLALGHHSYLLDGDNVRHGLNRDLGFTAADRVENIRRVAEVARLMVDAGLIVLMAFISPFRAERHMARGLLAEGEFVEIHVDTPLEVAEQRDMKGLYRKARAGQLKNFTGIDSPYEPPESPELRLNTLTLSAEEAAQRVIQYLQRAGSLRRAL